MGRRHSRIRTRSAMMIARAKRRPFFHYSQSPPPALPLYSVLLLLCGGAGCCPPAHSRLRTRSQADAAVRAVINNTRVHVCIASHRNRNAPEVRWAEVHARRQAYSRSTIPAGAHRRAYSMCTPTPTFFKRTCTPPLKTQQPAHLVVTLPAPTSAIDYSWSRHLPRLYSALSIFL